MLFVKHFDWMLKNWTNQNAWKYSVALNLRRKTFERIVPGQYDQTLKYQLAQNFPKLAQKVTTAV